MAEVEIARLVAQLDANVNKFTKAFEKAGAAADRELGNVERRGAAFAANMNSAMGAAGSGFKATERNVAALRGQTGNLASQFQDIAVQLQGGASPLTIALQQGTQISAVLGPLGAAGAVRGLGAAFLSVLNPVSLLTIGIIAAGGYAVQYFTSLINDGEASNEVVKKQQELVRAVAKEWGDAVPALQAYVAELDRAKAAGDQAAAVEVFSTDQFASARAELANVSYGLVEIVEKLRQLGANENEINALQAAFQALSTGIDEGKASTEQINAVQQAFAAATKGQSIPAVAAWGDEFLTFAAEVDVAIDAVAELNAQVAAQRGKRGDPRKFVRHDLEREQYFPAPQDPSPRPRSTGGGRARSFGGGSARNSAAEEAARERESVERLIEALAFEASMVGKSKEEKAAANAVRRLGSAATAEERQFVELATIAIMQQTEAIEANKQAAEELKSVTKGFLQDFFGGLEHGKTVWEAFGDAALNVLNKITDKLLDDVLNAIFDVNGALGSGGAGGGILGLLGGLFKAGLGGGGGIDPWGGMRANGGPVSSGKAYLVGERGPEIMVPRHAGSIIPNSKIGGGGGGPSVTQVYHIDARGAVEGTAEQIRKAIDANNRGAVPRISVQSMQRAQKYGVT